MSSRAPGTRREKGFLIDRAKALRSTDLAIRQVGWDGAHASLLLRLAGLWNMLWYGLARYPRWRVAMDPVYPSRARGWVMGPEVGLHPRFPGPSSEPNGDGLRG